MRKKTVPAAMRRIAGTKKRTTRSASRWIGALRACASSTACTMRDRTVSAPVRATRTRSRPVPFSDPATTGSPAAFGTGADSPDKSASSASDPPSTTFPSTGIRSPGTTSTRSPGEREATGTSAVPHPVPLSGPSRARAARAGRSRRSRGPSPPPRCTGQGGSMSGSSSPCRNTRPPRGTAKRCCSRTRRRRRGNTRASIPNAPWSAPRRAPRKKGAPE